MSSVAPAGAGALQPDELLLIYNGNVAASRELAGYYAKVRGVPAARLVPVQVDSRQEEMAADDFERLIRRPIRTHIEQAGLREQVRCLVTFHGLPIRVAQRPVPPEHAGLAETWRKQFISALDELERAIRELEGLGRDAPPPLSPRMPTEAEFPALLKRYPQSRIAAWQQITQLTDPEAAGQARQKLLEVVRKVEGVASLLDHLQLVEGEHREEAERQLEQMRQAVQQADARIGEALARSLEDPARDQARQWLREYHGLLGLLTSLRSDLTQVRPEETQAAVDSELALLWWDDYPKYRWVPNTLNWRVRTDAQTRSLVPAERWAQPVLMVSRIDAATPLIARRMIDRAVEAERRGLAGEVYLDARGLRPDEGHGHYDQNLRDLAGMLDGLTDLPVRLDNEPALFGPGRCPRTMLYCGWYSLRRYVDAFDFVPGAVGYHIASFEAISLKDPAEQGWCKRMLDDGITATLGPVAEPYLESFPLPKDFFGLLLTGRFTLAECYVYTSPFNSWMQILLGDPLYRPFARRGRLTVEQVFEPEHIPAEFRSAGTSQPTSSRAAR